MKFKDYYQILGVERSASPEQIKKAYRQLARKYHPDVSKEKDAEARFKEVAEAYETLKDPTKRAAYDQLGQHRGGAEFQPPPDWQRHFHGAPLDQGDLGEMDLSDLFAMFDELHPRNANRARRRGRHGGSELHAEAHISLEDAARGLEVAVNLPGRDGPLRVRIPKGVKDGDRLRVAGRGGETGGDAPQPDLHLRIRLQPHPWFRVHEHDLYLEVPVAPWESALGSSIEVPTLNGRVMVKVPVGVRSGQKLRLAGKGLPTAGAGNGDLYVVLQIVLPAHTNDRELALWNKLAEVSDFNPRSRFESASSEQSG